MNALRFAVTPLATLTFGFLFGYFLPPFLVMVLTPLVVAVWFGGFYFFVSSGWHR